MNKQMDTFGEHVFIAHSWKDNKIANKINQLVNENGFNTWLSRQENSTSTIPTYIQGELDKSYCVIVIWSENSRNSDWVLSEADYARSHNIELIHILIDSGELPPPFTVKRLVEKKHEHLKRGLVVDLKNWDETDTDSQFQQLLVALGLIAKIPYEYVHPTTKTASKGSSRKANTKILLLVALSTAFIASLLTYLFTSEKSNRSTNSIDTSYTQETPSNQYSSKLANRTNEKHSNSISTYKKLGWFIDGDKTLEDTMTSAYKGNTYSQYKLGRFFETGLNVPKVYPEALCWYSRASDNGSADAMAAIGMMYLEGKGVKRDKIRGINLLTKAANDGSAEAINNIFFAKNLGDISDELLDLLENAAKSGNPRSQYIIGTYYLNKDTPIEHKYAFKWLSNAAENQYTPSYIKLGLMYEYGFHVDRDFGEAMKWYRKAKNTGLSSAESYISGLKDRY